MSDTENGVEVRRPLWDDAKALAKAMLFAVAFTIAMW
jgi:hypothetical protein